jgi:tetratricopeptide (TPR) repeat protein
MGLVLARPSEFEFHLREGNKYFQNFQNEKALEHFKAAVEINPQHFEARMKYLRANNSIGQNLRDQGGDPKLTEYYFKQNVELAEKLYADFPSRVESSFSVAIAYGNLALYSSPREKVRLSRDIEKNLKRAIELDPKFPYSYLGLGIFYREVSKISFFERFLAKILWGEIPHATIEDALKNFELSLERDPSFLFTHFHFAKTLEQAEKLKEAADEYQKVLRLAETDSGDAYLKEASRKALKALEFENPSLFSIQEGSRD